MKNKRIIIIFSIVLFLALIVALSSILFRIDDPEVIYATDPVLNIDKDEVKNSLNQYEGTSIFFLNEKKLAEKLEASVGNIKVVNIERKFPNKVYITVRERIEVYCFKIGEDYVYTDYNCKVLRIEESKREVYGSEYGQVIDVTIYEGFVVSYKIGEILEFIEHGTVEFLNELFLNTTKDPIILRLYIKSVDLKFLNTSNSEAKIKMRTGAEFNFVHTIDYGVKYILYMNRLMENDETTGKKIDRISGVYRISYVNKEYEFIAND